MIFRIYIYTIIFKFIYNTLINKYFYKKGRYLIMKETSLLEVAEIMKTFDIIEITRLINDQINPNLSEDNSNNVVTDHFRSLYTTYAKLSKYKLDEEIKLEADNKFYDICRAFITAISRKFNLSIDSEWIDSNIENIPAFTLALYSFFVIDFSNNLYEVLLNYIIKNKNDIYTLFEEMKNNKDSATLANKKSMDQEIGLVVSNIYDISTFILNQLSEDDFFTYLNDSYIPLKILKILFNEGYVAGEFMSAINIIFQSNIQLKSKTCFSLIYHFRNK